MKIYKLEIGWLLLGLTIFTPLLSHAINEKKFVHPGIIHTSQDFERMRQVVSKKEFPGYGSFLFLENSPLAKSDYKIKGPFTKTEAGSVSGKVSADFSAAYQNAFYYALTGKVAHAEKTKEILLKYSSESGLKGFDGALITGSVWAVAYSAEILKYLYRGFTLKEEEQVKGVMRNVFVPAMHRQFYDVKPYTNGNWGAHITSGYMAMAIFLDDVEMYDFAKDFYLNGKDNGSIKNYVDDEGQCQESGRDNAHPQFGLANLAYTCEMAYKQGDDLYAAYDNRLLKAFEYTVRYNLGHEVPFKQWTDISGKYNNWKVISPKDRGRLDYIFEVAYNHYVIRKKLDMPYTEQALTYNRPEGVPNSSVNPFFGSLTFYEGPVLSDKNVGYINNEFRFSDDR